MGKRLLGFYERVGGHFRRQTRTVGTAVQHYLRGLLQAESKTMERMEEVIPDADHQALQHMLSESAWSERAVLDQVAQDAHHLLGGHADSSLLIDDSGFPKKGRHSVGVGRQWCGQLGKVENCQGGVRGVGLWNGGHAHRRTVIPAGTLDRRSAALPSGGDTGHAA
jgi:SRSO17 transposase